MDSRPADRLTGVQRAQQRARVAVPGGVGRRSLTMHVHGGPGAPAGLARPAVRQALEGQGHHGIGDLPAVPRYAPATVSGSVAAASSYPAADRAAWRTPTSGLSVRTLTLRPTPQALRVMQIRRTAAAGPPPVAAQPAVPPASTGPQAAAGEPRLADRIRSAAARLFGRPSQPAHTERGDEEYRDEAPAEQLRRAARTNARPLASWARPLAQEALGDTEPPRVAEGPESRRGLGRLDTRAATVDSTIHLAEPVDTPTPDAAEVLAHEIVHAASRPKTPRRFMGLLDVEERRARDAGRRARSVAESATAGVRPQASTGTSRGTAAARARETAPDAPSSLPTSGREQIAAARTAAAESHAPGAHATASASRRSTAAQIAETRGATPGRTPNAVDVVHRGAPGVQRLFGGARGLLDRALGGLGSTASGATEAVSGALGSARGSAEEQIAAARGMASEYPGRGTDALSGGLGSAERSVRGAAGQLLSRAGAIPGLGGIAGQAESALGGAASQASGLLSSLSGRAESGLESASGLASGLLGQAEEAGQGALESLAGGAEQVLSGAGSAVEQATASIGSMLGGSASAALDATSQMGELMELIEDRIVAEMERRGGRFGGVF